MARGSDRPHYGKFRGRVVDDLDPLGLGRAIVEVPSVGLSGWALPCVPFGDMGDEGRFSAPPPGTNVWVEFEGGDPDRPVWVGVFPDGV